MIDVCLDWNCIMGLEEEREYSPALRQIREWYKQGKIVLWIPSPSRMENHRSRDRRYYDDKEWLEKLRNVGLEGVELRSPSSRFFNVPGLQSVLIRAIHDRLFSNVPFLYEEYAQDQNVEFPEPRGVFFSSQSLQEEFEKESEEQRHLGRKWNNKKNDALNIYTFATWSRADDVFVSADRGDIIKKREKLQSPYEVKVARPVEVPGNHGERILQEKLEEIPGHIVIPGHILTPQETVEYLREQLEELSRVDNRSHSDEHLASDE